MTNFSPLFSKGKDTWQTPTALFAVLRGEFDFTIDGAADATNTLCPRWLGPGSKICSDALITGDLAGERIFCNPPYSRVAEFAKWASTNGSAVTVFLVPSRTDTKWWHSYVWDAQYHHPRSGVTLRFIKGRVKFISPQVRHSNSAPFPSVIIIFQS